MRMYDIIEKKRDGYELTKEEINFFITKYTAEEIPDYQASALLMAIYFQGMSVKESAYLTLAMKDSGETVDLSSIEGIKVDKHSTGGVGDTTTLILAPLVASVGVPVAKMSGRGLGHTGGTLDKLESIPNFDFEITNEAFISLVNHEHLSVVGQTGNLAPADKLLYSLRDVTATVNSIPLIASSIMSKKLASGADRIVLDVKTGKGAFMEKESDAIKLAELMVNIGNQVGKKTVAVISNMEQPLGNAIGNSLEVIEAIDTLRGNGPVDLTELCLVLGSKMVLLAEKAETEQAARKLLEESIHSGRAVEKFKSFITHQHGDARIVDDIGLLPQAKYQQSYYAKESGYIKEIIANELGKAALLLGAGRETKESVINLAVGIVLKVKVGDYLKKGDLVAVIHSDEDEVNQVERILDKAITYSNEQRKLKLIIGELD